MAKNGFTKAKQRSKPNCDVCRKPCRTPIRMAHYVVCSKACQGARNYWLKDQ
jgi:hypothetical protein